MFVRFVVAFKKLRVAIGLLDCNLARQASCQLVSVPSEAADNSVYVHYNDLTVMSRAELFVNLYSNNQRSSKGRCTPPLHQSR